MAETNGEPRAFLAWCYEVAPGQAALLTKAEVERRGLDDGPWCDVYDEWTPEITKAFPTRSGSHYDYATAMRMVGHRHSKTALIALVNWLLVETRKLRSGQGVLSPRPTHR